MTAWGTGVGDYFNAQAPRVTPLPNRPLIRPASTWKGFRNKGQSDPIQRDNKAIANKGSQTRTVTNTPRPPGA